MVSLFHGLDRAFSRLCGKGGAWTNYMPVVDLKTAITRNTRSECVLLNLIFWYLIFSWCKWWLNLAHEQPVCICEIQTVCERNKNERGWESDQALLRENIFILIMLFVRSTRASVAVRAVRSAMSCLFGPYLCCKCDQRSECDLQAKVRLASLLTIVPKELEARHWYVPASSSLLRWLMRRLPPERLWWEPGLGLTRLPFSFHLQDKWVYSSEISIWTQTFLIMTFHDETVTARLINVIALYSYSQK